MTTSKSSMNNNGTSIIDDLFRSEAHVLNTTFSFITSMSLKCAIELGIPDAIHGYGGRPVTLPELVSKLGLPPVRTPCVARLMRALVQAGWFVIKRTGSDSEEGYVLTPSSSYLRDQAAPFPKSMLEPAMVEPWLHLTKWFRSDDAASPTPFHVAHGMGLWEYAGRKPEFSQMFNEAMAHDADFVTERFVAMCWPAFEGGRSLVDVGGGNGAVTRAIAEAFPHLKCTVFDLPHVITGLPPSSTVDYLAGSMFDFVPKADVVFLKWILHDYNDEDCIKILQQCKKAIPGKEEGGKVVVIDMVFNTVKDNYYFKAAETQCFFDMQLMVILGGKERDEHEWREIFTQAGFTSYKVTPISDFYCLMEISAP